MVKAVTVIHRTMRGSAPVADADGSVIRFAGQRGDQYSPGRYLSLTQKVN